MEDNMSKITEHELAEPIVAWLMAEGWDVYQEVELYAGGPIVDIVAKRKRVLWAIECKVSLTATLCGQAFRLQCLSRFNQVSVAVPDMAKSHGYAQLFLRNGLVSNGIGTVGLRFNPTTHEPEVYVYQIAGQIPSDKLVAFMINEKQKTWAKAGNADGKRWTPFQQTVENLKAFIFFIFDNSNHALTMKEIVEGIDHHYKSDASARNSLRVWIDTGKVKGIIKRTPLGGGVTTYHLDWAERNERGENGTDEQ